MTTLHTIAFDYLPISPLQKGWRKAYNPRGDAKFSTDPTRPVLIITITCGVFAMDFDVPQKAALSDRLLFSAKYKDGEKSMIFAKIIVATRNGLQRRMVWLKFYPGNEPAHPTSGNVNYDPDKELPEQTVYIPAVYSSDGGLINFTIDLPDAVRLSLGADGWVYDSLEIIRLRGNLTISPILLSRSELPNPASDFARLPPETDISDTLKGVIDHELYLAPDRQHLRSVGVDWNLVQIDYAIDRVAVRSRRQYHVRFLEILQELRADKIRLDADRAASLRPQPQALPVHNSRNNFPEIVPKQPDWIGHWKWGFDMVRNKKPALKVLGVIVIASGLWGGWPFFLKILPSHTGSLTIDTIPRGAHVQVDSSLPETSPWTVPAISTGIHTVTVNMDGYKTNTSSRVVRAHESAKYTISLERILVASDTVITSPVASPSISRSQPLDADKKSMSNSSLQSVRESDQLLREAMQQIGKVVARQGDRLGNDYTIASGNNIPDAAHLRYSGDYAFVRIGYSSPRLWVHYVVQIINGQLVFRALYPGQDSLPFFLTPASSPDYGLGFQNAAEQSLLLQFESERHRND